jgi:ATP-dependent exoDNAse (exonuclease V) beta subunit
MARVSFSQYSMWSSCPQQYKLSYIDGLSQSTSNIHSVFGSAMHETLQEYLSRCLRISKSQADKGMDTKAFLKEKMREIFLKESNEGKDPICTKEELVEFLEDGNLILDYFQKSKNFNNFFSLKYDELVAIEQPINTKIREHINFLGFIDLVVRSTFDGKYRIIDFKTSTSGWSKYQKKDPTKNAQILLYKKFYSEMLGVSMDMIDVEFIILKRKVSENTDYHIPRISRHVPANGKPSINKAWNEFNTFVDNVFNPDGTYRTDVQFPKKPSKLCGWCEFYGTHCDGK